MSDSEYSVIKNDVIKRFDLSVAQHPCLFRQNFSNETKGHRIGRCMVTVFSKVVIQSLHYCEKLKHLFIISFLT